MFLSNSSFPSPAQEGDMSSRQSKVVFVGNIPYDMSEEQLTEIFKEVGPLVNFRYSNSNVDWFLIEIRVNREVMDFVNTMTLKQQAAQ